MNKRIRKKQEKRSYEKIVERMDKFKHDYIVRALRQKTLTPLQPGIYKIENLSKESSDE